MEFFSRLFDSSKDEQKNVSIKDQISREIFNVSPEAIIFVDCKGQIIHANQRIEDWLGYKAESIINKHVSRLPFLAKQDRAIIAEKFQKRVKGENISPYEISFVAKDKSLVVGRINGSIVKDDKKSIVGALIMISNVTENKKIDEQEHALYKDLKILSETASGLVELPKNQDIYKFIGEKLYHLLGDNQVAILKWNPQKKVNKTIYYFGATKQEEAFLKRIGKWPVGREIPLKDYAIKDLLERKLVEIEGKLYEMFQGEISKPVTKLIESVGRIEKVFTMGFAWEGELFGSAVAFIRKDSLIREESISAFLHQASVALQKRKADEALQKAHDELQIKIKERTEDLEKFQLAVENASDNIMITDPEGRILYVNHASEQITGYRRDEVIGKTPKVWGDQMPKEFYRKLWDDIKKKRVLYIGEINNLKKDGTSYIADLQIAPILNQEGKVIFFVGIERDITKAKEIDKAKSEFVSLASHQLRTPLSVIKWYAEMLLSEDSGKVNKEQKEFLDQVYGASVRMVELVNALLNVSRIDLGTFVIEPKKVDLVEIVKSEISELKIKYRDKQIQILEKYQGELSHINADPKLLRIIYQNLISNAIKYTPKGGKISVSISAKKKVDGGIIELIVSDNGYGIPKNQQSDIFGKLFRADNAREKVTEGTGLGLYLVKSILDHIGGKIWFKSVENKGTTFTVTFPLSGMPEKKGTKALT